MTPSSGRIDTCPTFCVALCWRDARSPSQPLISLSACCHPPEWIPSRAQDPHVGPRPWHSPLCCIPPLAASGARALPEGATSAAPDLHSGVPLAEMGGLGGFPRSPSMVQPRGVSVSACVQTSPPSLDALGAPASLFHPPLWPSLGSICMPPRLASKDPPLFHFLWGLKVRTDWPGLKTRPNDWISQGSLSLLWVSTALHPLTTHSDLHWPAGLFTPPASSVFPASHPSTPPACLT